jgi:hypothetical protein
MCAAAAPRAVPRKHVMYCTQLIVSDMMARVAVMLRQA